MSIAQRVRSWLETPAEPSAESAECPAQSDSADSADDFGRVEDANLPLRNPLDLALEMFDGTLVPPHEARRIMAARSSRRAGK